MFKKRSEWKLEIDILLAAINDDILKAETFNTGEKEDAEVAIARKRGRSYVLSLHISDINCTYFQMKAVYPVLEDVNFKAMTSDVVIDSNLCELLKCTLDTFPTLPHVDIASLLDGSSEVHAESVAEFNDKMDRFLKPNQGENSAQLWPLITLVQMQCNSPVLANGVVLVDLPGVADSNTARGNVALNYIKDAHYIWIVAQIQR